MFPFPVVLEASFETVLCNNSNVWKHGFLVQWFLVFLMFLMAYCSCFTQKIPKECGTLDLTKRSGLKWWPLKRPVAGESLFLDGKLAHHRLGPTGYLYETYTRTMYIRVYIYHIYIYTLWIIKYKYRTYVKCFHMIFGCSIYINSLITSPFRW